MSDGLQPMQTGGFLATVTASLEKIVGRPVDLTGEQRTTTSDLIERSRANTLAHRQEKARALSEIGPRFRERTFTTFIESPDNRSALRAAHRVVESGFDYGLGLHGVPGVGKTHLSAAIGNAAIAAGKVAVSMPVALILAKIRDTFHDAAEREDREATERSLVKFFATADVLALDDLGKEQRTNWTLTTLYAIVNERYENNLPVIVTSNLDPAQLIAHYSAQIAGVDPNIGVAIMDRILEMSGAPWVKVGGVSARWGN